MFYNPAHKGEVEMSDAYVKVEGWALPPFGMWTMFVASLPGATGPERIPIVNVFITDQGEVVFVSKPYPNLAKLPEQWGDSLSDEERRKAGLIK